MSHIEARSNLDSYVDSFFGDDDDGPRQPAYCASCVNLFSICCPSNYQLAGVELCPYYVPDVGGRQRMTTKAEVRKEWLNWAVRWYDQKDEKGKRDLFIQTCKAASRRFTQKELEDVLDIIRQQVSGGTTNGTN